MDKPKYKFSLKVLGLGILLLAASVGLAYFQYDLFENSGRIYLALCALVGIVFISGIFISFGAFRSGSDLLEISMPISMKDKAKFAVESGDLNAYKALLKGEKLQSPCKEYVKLEFEKFPEQPHLARVGFSVMILHPVGNFFEHSESIPRATIEGPVVKVLDELFEHYKFS